MQHVAVTHVVCSGVFALCGMGMRSDGDLCGVLLLLLGGGWLAGEGHWREADRDRQATAEGQGHCAAQVRVCNMQQLN
jgi:hypothetical protein